MGQLRLRKNEQGKQKELLFRPCCTGSLGAKVQLLQPQCDQCKLRKPLGAYTDLIVTVPGSVLVSRRRHDTVLVA